jgi:CelD/BcsL family acetyltransferase involved in cellulose biosynthesis
MAESNDGNRAQKLGSRLIENNLRLEIVTDVERLFSLKSHWDNLCHRSNGCNFSQSFQWCSAAWNIIGHPRRRQLLCLVGWVNNRMVLIWPLVIQRRALWFLLRPLGSETTEYSDVLVENSSEADRWVTLAWQKLRTTHSSDIVALPFVRTNSRLHRIISQERPMSAWVNSISSVSWDGYQDWESYYQSLKRDFRHSLRRTRRRLAQRGNLSFEAVTKPEEFRPIINWLFSHKAEWLIRTKQDSPWQNAELYKEFLIHVAAEREEVGDVTLFVLKFDGQIISAVLTRNSKFSAEAVIAAFDRTYSKYGPGQLLYEDILKWAFKRRLEFDFRIGNQPYKRHWINRESTVATYRFVNSIWGAAFSLASQCRSKSKSLRFKLLPFRPTDPYI